MSSRVQKQKQSSRQDTAVEEVEPKKRDWSSAATDELMDEIDNILDTPLVAKDFKQKGGQ